MSERIWAAGKAEEEQADQSGLAARCVEAATNDNAARRPNTPRI
jgi:hypothetical protein